MSETPIKTAANVSGLFVSGSFGVGAALVALPALLLFFGAGYLKEVSIIGLPLLAIFGIMILFGSLALVAMLFQSLDLSNKDQPLALPEGSIRAAIALSLIVLFAIISIMLFQSSSGVPFPVDGLTAAQRSELVAKAADRVVTSGDAPCAVPAAAASAASAGAASATAAAAASAPCAETDRRFTVYLRPGVASETTDLAKQLLILVGTLMTSVTSYYFAARSMSSATASAAGAPSGQPADPKPGGPKLEDDDQDGKGSAAAAAVAAAAAATEAHVDGCDVAITDATPDEALPLARGGVAKLGG